MRLKASVLELVPPRKGVAQLEGQVEVLRGRQPSLPGALLSSSFFGSWWGPGKPALGRSCWQGDDPMSQDRRRRPLLPRQHTPRKRSTAVGQEPLQQQPRHGAAAVARTLLPVMERLPPPWLGAVVGRREGAVVAQREGAVVGAHHGEGPVLLGYLSPNQRQQATACWHQRRMPYRHLRWCAGGQRVARGLEAGAAEGSHLPQQVRVS